MVINSQSPELFRFACGSCKPGAGRVIEADFASWPFKEDQEISEDTAIRIKFNIGRTKAK